MPGDRAEIDDGATTALLHARHDRLRAEQQVTQIDGHTLIPVSGGDVAELMAIIVGGVIHQHIDRSDLFERLRYRIQIGKIAAPEHRRVQVIAKRLTQCNGGFLLHIQKSYLRALTHKGGDNACANARATAGDNHTLVFQTGIDGVSHDSPAGANRPRCARLRIKLPMPNCQGGAWSQLATSFSSTPRDGVLTYTRSPCL